MHQGRYSTLPNSLPPHPALTRRLTPTHSGFSRSGLCFPNFRLLQVLGWLSGLDLAEAYGSADILLFPSDVETFGNVTLEALASGIPAIVEQKCSAHLVTDTVEGFAVHQACIFLCLLSIIAWSLVPACSLHLSRGRWQGIDDPNDKAQYGACVDRYFDATRKVVTDAALRLTMARNARAKVCYCIPTFSVSIVLSSMANISRVPLLFCPSCPTTLKLMVRLKPTRTEWYSSA